MACSARSAVAAGDDRPGLRRANRSGIRRSAASRAACRRRRRRGDTSRHPRPASSTRLDNRSPPVAIAVGPRRIAALASTTAANSSSTTQQEPAHPDAFALPAGADFVHAVVPIAAAHQRQAMRAEAQAVLDRPQAMLEQRTFAERRSAATRNRSCSCGSSDRELEVTALVRREWRHRRCVDIVADDERQPEIVVGEARADAAAGRRMPPMLHVAFLELLRGRCRMHMLARTCGMAVHQRHHILQLVAESERSARLIERRASPDAATERLVQQPVVDERIERAVGRVDFDRGWSVRQKSAVCSMALVDLLGRFETSYDRLWCHRASASPSRAEKINSASCARRELIFFCTAPQGSSPAPVVPESLSRCKAAGLFEATVAADEFRPIAGHANRRRRRT